MPGVDRPLTMLVVEDNLADVAFLREAIDAAETSMVVHTVANGDDALRFLRRQPPFAAAPRPDVVVLDLNLPVKNGQEVLVEMAADPALNGIPVAILTTSTSDPHVCELYPAGRCVYLSKTPDFRKLVNIVQQIAAHATAMSITG